MKSGGGGREARRAQVGSDLSPVIDRVHHHVLQDVPDRALPRLALAVDVGDPARERVFGEVPEERRPGCLEPAGLARAIRERERGPDRQQDSSRRHARQPERLGAEHVRHPLHGRGRRRRGGPERRQGFAVGPGVVGEEAREVRGHLHRRRQGYARGAAPGRFRGPRRPPTGLRRSGEAVHPSQAFGEHPHDVQREVGRLLHEEEEALLVDGGDFHVGLGHGRGEARLLVDQGHLPEDPARADALDELALDREIDLSFHDGVHEVAGVAFPENRRARRKGLCIAGVLEKTRRDHRILLSRPAFPAGSCGILPDRVEGGVKKGDRSAVISPAAPRRRKSHAAAARSRHGSQIQRISVRRIATPRDPKNPSMPSGDTGSGARERTGACCRTARSTRCRRPLWSSRRTRRARRRTGKEK